MCQFGFLTYQRLRQRLKATGADAARSEEATDENLVAVRYSGTDLLPKIGEICQRSVISLLTLQSWRRYEIVPSVLACDQGTHTKYDFCKIGP